MAASGCSGATAPNSDKYVHSCFFHFPGAGLPDASSAATVRAYLDVQYGHSAFRIVCDSPYRSLGVGSNGSVISFGYMGTVLKPQIPVTQAQPALGMALPLQQG